MNSNLNRKPFFSSNAFILSIALAFLLAACLINLQTKRPEIFLSKQDTAININTKFLVILSAGHKRLITDLLWIQTLMESDIEHYQKKDLNSWMFLRFNTISVLDPKFYENYSYGGQFLAIVKDDLVGADRLYEKALHIYPDDYTLNFQAGFMYYYEMGNFEKGLTYLSKIMSHPSAPTYLVSIVNKLKYEVTGDLKTTFDLVALNYQNTKDEHLKARLWTDLYAIKAEIDLKCLNNNQVLCEKKDLNGDFYLKQGNQFHSVKKFKKYEIKKRGENKASPQDLLIDTIR